MDVKSVGSVWFCWSWFSNKSLKTNLVCLMIPLSVQKRYCSLFSSNSDSVCSRFNEVNTIKAAFQVEHD